MYDVNGDLAHVAIRRNMAAALMYKIQRLGNELNKMQFGSNCTYVIL